MKAVAMIGLVALAVTACSKANTNANEGAAEPVGSTDQAALTSPSGGEPPTDFLTACSAGGWPGYPEPQPFGGVTVADIFSGAPEHGSTVTWKEVSPGTSYIARVNKHDQLTGRDIRLSFEVKLGPKVLKSATRCGPKTAIFGRVTNGDTVIPADRNGDLITSMITGNPTLKARLDAQYEADREAAKAGSDASATKRGAISSSEGEATDNDAQPAQLTPAISKREAIISESSDYGMTIRCSRSGEDDRFSMDAEHIRKQGDGTYAIDRSGFSHIYAPSTNEKCEVNKIDYDE